MLEGNNWKKETQMMKFFKSLLICLLPIHFCNAQDEIADLKIIYEGIFKDTTTLSNSTKTVEYTLLCNSKNSIFASTETMYYYKKSYEPSINSINSIRPKASLSIYKDGDKVTGFFPIEFTFYSFSEPNLIWELIPIKTKYISQFNCQFAKSTTDTGKIFYAWYTTAFPIPEGPFRFKGLPGLVLEAYSEDKLIRFVAIGMNKTTEKIEKLKYNSTYPIKNKANFLQKREEYFKNPNAFLPHSTLKILINGQEMPPFRYDGPIKVNRKLLLD